MNIKSPAYILPFTLICPTPVFAQQSVADVQSDTAVYEVVKARFEAEKAAIEARSARDKAKVDSLGLPSFTNSTTLGDKAGYMESAILTSAALKKATITLEEKLKPNGKTSLIPNGVILVADDVSVNFGLYDEVIWEIASTNLELARTTNVVAQNCKGGAKVNAAEAGVVTIISALTAAAGLISSEVTVTGLADTADGSMLINSLAGRLGDDTIIYGYGLGWPEIDEDKNQLLSNLKTVRLARITADQAKSVCPEAKSQDDNQKKAVAALDSATKRYDEFYGRLLKVENGTTLIGQALRLQQIGTRDILRVKLVRSGGSFLNSKNLWTTFGLDPVKVSGGVIVTYALQEKASGKIKSAGSFACQTTLTSMRKILENRWVSRKDGKVNDNEAWCTDIF